ncbi:MAG: hypothetical protein LAP85_10510 [Acidobacteriia bacterium]|nr:hypothetical protein [Terriglobia bacterium]
MLFAKKDEAKKWIAKVRELQKVRADLQREFAAIRPKWHEAQREAEQLESLRLAKDGSYSRQVCEELWAERDAVHKAELEAAIARRDALTADLVPQLRATKDKLHRALSAVCGSFGNVVGAVCAQLPENSELRTELAAVLRQCEACEDPTEIILTITKWIERLEESESVSMPFYRFDRVLAAALGQM